MVEKMKGNDGTGNNVNRDDWQTPQEMWDLLNEQYEFLFDCCASQKNSKCSFFTNDFLSVGDKENIENECFTCWMNPPFSKATEMFEHFFKVVKYGVAIYRCDNMETKVWQEIILKNATWVFIPNKIITYKGLSNKWDRPVFGSALIGVGVEKPINIKGITLRK